ncbi:MAG TPA: chemotaxis protein [Rhizobiales bacterium]|nr:chemotaxis regulator CheZ [bacterium BMS3Bbin10]HDO51621.1 chemotaxis protein [Hyphomicrobiales bacterium]
MSSPVHSEIREAADSLTHKDDISLVDVLSLAEASIHSMKTFIDSLDSKVYEEFRGIAEYIQNTKLEIGNLQANDLTSNHIPVAGDELNLVVSSTEEATTKIMECAESVLDADSSDPDAYKELVNAKMMDIFEACSFQDLTGQRITKVVETLEHIETRVSRFAAAIGAGDGDEPANEKEAKRKKRKEDQILNGPAKKGEGVSQDDIDALLNF